MMQRDFILKELEKLNLLLVKLMGLKDDGRTPEANELINNHFEQTSGQQIHELDNLEDSETITFLKEEKKLKPIEFKVLAELCFQAAEFATPPCSAKSINLYRKTLIILEHITAIEKTFDFEREERIALIRTKINDCTD
ncbi:hypothetical protein GCM10009122_50790 [Fulvivirga kasyanovii]|uniref:TerB family tellurite resistance protein n=1 Tax=Fulvivirga kasyanovii TaxID=396812 RepID=A0ABW9RLV5_9BACT|nr:hypothetical protein [Fulvivirga kasyanovii]MTI25102.1 hypothetical protein [Fulvivirga kasyanovii]